tara:strand:- start:3331 stop:4464 length:1134 start_codon:yes stop_codon:yes gene_type:complete
MANTLTNLTPDLYEALDTVSRELVGMIPAVTLDANAERAAVGQTIRSAVAPASAAADIAPAQIAPNTGDQVITNKTLSISKSRGVAIRYNGEEQRGLNTGPGYNSILQGQFAQAMRTLTNEVEADLTALYTQASTAFGTPGTTPFGTAGNFTDASNSLKLLKDNGAPLTNNQLIINSAAGASMLGLQSRVDVQGNDSMLRQGVILSTAGMDIRESAQIKDHTRGTANANYVTDGISAEGATVIGLKTGSGTVLAGDTLTFAGDTTKYVVTGALAGGNVTIAAPGLQGAIADEAAVTVGVAYAANMAFNRDAIVLVARAPARPVEGDLAEDVMLMTDPRSGITFEVSMYKEYRQVHFEVALAWGVAAIKPEHMAILLG